MIIIFIEEDFDFFLNVLPYCLWTNRVVSVAADVLNYFLGRIGLSHKILP